MGDNNNHVISVELREFCTLLIKQTANEQELKYIEQLSPLRESIGNIHRELSEIHARLVPDAEARLTEIETKIKPLFSNGQPGLCAEQAQRIKELEDAAAERKGWNLSRRSLVAAVATILTMVIGLAGTGLEAYSILHKQSEDIRNDLKATEDRISSHQDSDNETIKRLQSELNQVSHKASTLESGVDRNSGQIRGVGSQVDQLDWDVNKPKTHWYKSSK